MPRNDEWVPLHDCKIVRETDKAILVEYDGEDVWLPHSQIREAYKLEIGTSGVTVEVTAWLCKQKGIEA